MTAPESLVVFSPASHSNVLAMIMQIAILLLTARAFGEIAQRFKQPSVVGEIFAGIILGPSVLGQIFPGIIGYIIPANEVQGHLLEAVSLIGAIFLLLITGLETDLKLIKHHARTALGVSLGGILVTFSSGFLLGQHLPADLLVSPEKRTVFALFLATAMSISAIPVIAKVLIELKYTRRDIGQTIIAAGMSDDTIGWILLSVVAGLAAGEAVTAQSVGASIGKVLAFLLISFTFGQWLVKRIFNFVQDKVTSRDRLLTLVVVLAFIWGSITQLLHLEAVLGAFVMGILFSQVKRLPHEVHNKLESVALAIFAPIFFATAGLKVSIQELMRPDLIVITLLVILIASLGKVIGTYAGARLVGRKGHWYALSFGAALNARGAMEIIIATIGLSLGILTQEMFSIIVVMAIVTSLVTPSVLQWVLKKVPISDQERKRLKNEEMTEGSSIANIHRILMPVRYRNTQDMHLKTMQVIKTRILQNISRNNDLSITLLNVEKDSDEGKGEKFLNFIGEVFEGHEVIKKNIESVKPADEIIAEAKKEYEMLILGATKSPGNTNYVFSETVDDIIRLVPCPTMIVHALEAPQNWHPKKILVPSNGSNEAFDASELAFLIASTGKESVKVLNVIERDNKNLYHNLHDEHFRTRLKVAADMLKPIKEMGDAKDIPTEIDAKTGPSPEQIIIDTAKEENFDLIILGTSIHHSSKRLFLGDITEYIINNAHCPVITLNTIQD